MNKKIICISIIGMFLIICFSQTVSANSPPDPDKPSGPKKIIVNRIAFYSCSATDPDGDDVFLKLKIAENTTGPMQRSTDWYQASSGETIQIPFSWLRAMNREYTLMLIAKDSKGAVSIDKPSLSVQVGLNIKSAQPAITRSFTNILIDLFQHFSLLQTLVQQL